MTLLPETGSFGSRLAALGLLVGAILSFGVWVVQPWYSHMTAQRDDMERTQARIARAEQNLAALKAANLEAPSAVSANLSALAISAPSATRASARLVQLAKQKISSAGCNVVSLEARPAKSGAVGLKLEARAKLVCDTPHLQELLYAIETMQPVTLISGLRIRSRAGRAETSNLLDIELDLSAFLIQEILPGEVKS